MMTKHLLVCGIVLGCVLLSAEAQGSTTTPPHGLLECRLCRNVRYLEDCTETQLCLPNNECYIEEYITPQLQIVFNAGCRSTTLCRSISSYSGKRSDGSLITCSSCCNDTSSSNGTECNTKLCGLATTGNRTTPPLRMLECRLCRNALYLEDCTETELCDVNEECYIDEIVSAHLQIVYNAGCRSTKICNTSYSHFGKRADGSLIVCSQCCNEYKPSNGSHCNTMLCGIKTNGSRTSLPHGLLECRICRNALHLGDCTETQICIHNEECYTEEVITPQLEIVFNAGCRMTSICRTSSSHSLRIADDSLLVCSHCCNDSIASNGTECNTKLCGLQTRSRASPALGLLECRLCRDVFYLEDCTGTQLCLPNEECYVDESITPELQIVFNAGCRSSKICNTTSTHVGKRASDSSLIACTECCNDYKALNGTECNANLCGLISKSTHISQCYYCGENADAKQGAVSDPRKCRQIKFCADDEVCHVKTRHTDGFLTSEFGCEKALKCRIQTIIQLEHQGVRTGFDVGHLIESPLLVGKRQTNVCDMCCGDGLCNDDTCISVRNRIVVFAKMNRFNYTTLKIIP